MDIAFSGRNVRACWPIFFGVAQTVRPPFLGCDVYVHFQQIVHEWEALCSSGASVRVNIFKTVNLATLDIISDGKKYFPFWSDWMFNSFSGAGISYQHRTES
jgi:hypothetical protein